MDTIFNFIITILKLPFVAFTKTLITTLNMIPLPVYEIYGRRGTGPSERPDLREIHTKIKGQRRAHLGTATIAFVRGALIKVHLNSQGKTSWGIYTEDYQDIQCKWVW